MRFVFLILSLIFIFFTTTSQAQKIPILTKPSVDTNYVDILWDQWSLRAFGQIDYQTLHLSSLKSGEKVKYRPNNLLGVGIGFTYKLLLLDFNFKLNLNDENGSTGFGLHLNFAASQNHFIKLDFQRFSGFERLSAEESNTFREDINTTTYGVQYKTNFKNNRFLLRSVSSADQIIKSNSYSFFIGGFFNYHKVEADESLIPNDLIPFFNEDSQWTRSRYMNIGVNAGGAFVMSLSRHFYFYGQAMPGIGLNIGQIEALETYSTPLGPMFNINGRTAFGFASNDIYIIASAVFDFTWNRPGRGNRYSYNQGIFKFTIGKRFGSKIQILEGINETFERK